MAGAAKPDGKRPSARVSFTRQDAQRIGKAVRAYEAGDKKGKPLSFEHRQYQNPDVVRMATFSGDSSGGWPVYSDATITFTNSLFGGETAVAHNRFVSLGGAGVCEVAVARDISNSWNLISWPVGQVCDTALVDISMQLNTATCAIVKTLHTVTVQFLQLTFPYVTCSGQD